MKNFKNTALLMLIALFFNACQKEELVVPTNENNVEVFSEMKTSDANLSESFDLDLGIDIESNATLNKIYVTSEYITTNYVNFETIMNNIKNNGLRIVNKDCITVHFANSSTIPNWGDKVYNSLESTVSNDGESITFRLHNLKIATYECNPLSEIPLCNEFFEFLHIMVAGKGGDVKSGCVLGTFLLDEWSEYVDISLLPIINKKHCFGITCGIVE